MNPMLKENSARSSSSLALGLGPLRGQARLAARRKRKRKIKKNQEKFLVLKNY
jgi:hypothetical protein